jgi:hypothetical protein
MQVSAISGNSGARKISDALVMAEDQLENLMALPYDHADLDTGSSSNPHQIDAGGYTMIWNVISWDLNQYDTIADDAKQIELTATHQGDRSRTATIRYIIPES